MIIKVLKIVFLLSFFFSISIQARGQKIGRLIPASDKFSWEGCEDVKPTDFVQTKVVDFPKHGVRQPVHVTFNKTSDVPNFYFIEKITGRVRYYVDATGEVEEVGNVKDELHTGGTEDGLNGIALDYDFDTTRWMYLFYSVKGFFRIARIKVSADNKLQNDTRQVILDVPKNDGKWHASGKMDFDVYGDLWIAIGDNLLGYYGDNTYITMATADLRGSWLRIHPTENKVSGKYYTIPKDNFGEYWAKEFEKQGKTELAGQYRNPELVLPEIFSKGVRNSWGLKVVEPFVPVVASGECGPDHPKPDGFTEETNVVSKPGFHGWPIHSGIVDWQYYDGKQVRSLPGGTVYDSLAPRIENNDKIKGVRVLPPIVTPVYKWEYWGRSCGTGAAVYWYDGYAKSKRKFPPHFNGKLFATDHDTQWIRIVTLNKTMDTALSESEFFDPNKQIEYQKPVDVTFGPDGALYVVHFIGGWFKDNPAQHISRIDYTGDCHPELPKSPFRGCMVPTAGNYDPRVKHGCPNNECCIATSVKVPDEQNLFTIGIHKSRITVSIKGTGPHAFKIFNANGELLDSKRGPAAANYHFTHLPLGLYFIELNVNSWKYAKKVLVYF